MAWGEFVAFIQQNKILFLTLIYGSVLLDVLMISARSDVVIFSLLGVYIFLIKTYKLKSTQTFTYCLVLLLVMYGNLLVTGPEIQTEKSAVWLVLFMLVGIIQQWRE